MSAYNFDPEECKKALEEVGNEILETLVTGKADGFVNLLRNNDEKINIRNQDVSGCLWEPFQISAKMNALKESIDNGAILEGLGSENPRDDENYFLGMDLMRQKQQFETKIKELQSKAVELQTSIQEIKQKFEDAPEILPIKRT